MFFLEEAIMMPLGESKDGYVTLIICICTNYEIEIIYGCIGHYCDDFILIVIFRNIFYG